MKIPPIMNPLSKKYDCLTQFKTDLTKRQKTAAIAAAIFASILPVFGTTAAFRKVVMHYTTKEDLGQKQAELKAQWLASGKVKIAEKTLQKEAFTLFDKLSALGIGPADIRFQNIWFKNYFSSCANTLFGPEGVFQESDRVLYMQNPNENLILYFPDEVTMERCRNTCAQKKSENRTYLTVSQAFRDEPLPEEFVQLIKKS